MTRLSPPRVGIIGAGMSGLCMGAKLLAAGHENFVLYEKAGEVGGTWRENTYPGLSCDVPCRFYSYSFAPNPDWSRNFASGAEIQHYFVRCAESFGVRPYIRFNAEVVAARWVDGRWRLRTRDGAEDLVDVLVAATGVLHHPKLPDINGLDSFAGAAFHSSRWDHSVPLEGRRVAVIGTGSTGVQVTTALSKTVGQLFVFQRTPQWIMPGVNVRYSSFSRAAFRHLPILNRISYRFYYHMYGAVLGKAMLKAGWQRRFVNALCQLHLRLGVRDPELRRRLTPADEPMCRRLIMASGYYRALRRQGTHLVTESIDHIAPQGIVTADGRLHEVDVIVLATGFDAHAFIRPIDLVGEGGVTIDHAWRDGPRAYRTVCVPGFPNFFILQGPHSPIGNHSLIAIAETQTDYVMRWLEKLRNGRVHIFAPTAEATDAFNATLREVLPHTVWASGCNSWYLGTDGLPELWPWTPAHHQAMLAEPVLEHFSVQ